MPALNAPGIDAAPPDSVSRPCTNPGAGRAREGDDGVVWLVRVAQRRGTRSRSRRPEGLDVHLDPGRGGLLCHAQHLLGGGRARGLLAAVGADHRRYVLGHSTHLTSIGLIWARGEDCSGAMVG